MFLEYEFVVGHVFLGVGFQVSLDFVQVEAVLVAALLAVQKELAELGSPEGGSYHAVVQHELVHGENGDG